MIHLKDDRIVIEIDTPLPKEWIKDLQHSIVEILQNQYTHKEEEAITEITDELKEANYFMLELLKHTFDGYIPIAIGRQHIELKTLDAEVARQLIEDLYNVLAMCGINLEKE